MNHLISLLHPVRKFSDYATGTLFALALALLGTGCASLPGASTLRTDTGSMSFAQTGNGGPTVVFEAGAGDGMETWDKVFPEVAKFTTAFAYSRRGHDIGLPVLLHRDGVTIVGELRDALAAQHLKPPFILVGHSIGGLYLQLFAKLLPDEVAGVVLVDPTHPDQLQRMKKERPGNHALLQTMMVVNSAKTLAAELRGMTETSREWHAAGGFPPCPMTLLSANRASALDGAGFPAFMHRLHAELVSAWPGAEQRFVDSSHYIQRERPDLVVNAIRDIIARIPRDPE